MNVDFETFSKMKEIADVTCGNSFLMDDGEIVDRHKFRMMCFDHKLHCVAIYSYNERKILKI